MGSQKRRNPYDRDMRMIEGWKRTGKLPPPSKVIDVLTIILCHRDLHNPESDEAPVHVELIELIGELLGGKVAWAEAQAERQRQRAARKRQRYQALAARVWAKNPGLSAKRVGEMIAEQHGGNASTIRRMIRRPK